MTFVAVENKRGYIIHRCDEKGVANTAGEPVLEQVECPEGVVVSSAGLPDADLPQLTRPPGVACTSPGASTLKAKNPRAAGLISAAESKAAAQAVRRLYRVRGGVDGVGGVRTPDIDAPVADVMEEGSAFFTKAEVRFLVLTGGVKGHGVLLASARAVVRILEAFVVPLFLYGFSRLRVVVGARCW